MYILSAQQIRDWDRFTIGHEPIASIDLMERAAQKCTEWIMGQGWNQRSIKVFCGRGNNGGDGLAIARMLSGNGFTVSVFQLDAAQEGSEDFEINLRRLRETGTLEIILLNAKEEFPLLHTNDILVDALFGTGLSKPLEGLVADLVQHLNHSGAHIVSVDLPSGLFADRSSQSHTVVEADDTLTFQCLKTGLLLAENAAFTGTVHVLDIGLHPDFPALSALEKKWVDREWIQTIFRPRRSFAHKGDHGHCLLIAGSYGKMGAAVLAAKACVRGGAGLTTCLIPRCGYGIMQTSVPEAMVLTGKEEEWLSELPEGMEKYRVIGLGPGLGTAEETRNLVSFVVRRFPHPLVIDADGLNCLAQDPELLKRLPPNSILTPHPREFDRLFGAHGSDFDRLETLSAKAAELGIIIVLKGHHTVTAVPGGALFFNSTGNAGMAKGGSGDVLTGLITALVAQDYEPALASVFGVYLHGRAGDRAALACSKEAMTASDLIDHFGAVFLELNNDCKVQFPVKSGR